MTERSASQLLDELERASRKRQPWLIVGLVAIVVGFLTFSIYLNSLLSQARRQAAASEARATSLSVTLEQARDAVRKGDRKAAFELLGVALEQTEELPLVADASPAPAPTLAPTPITSPTPRSSPRPKPSAVAGIDKVVPVTRATAMPPVQQAGPPPEQQFAPSDDKPSRMPRKAVTVVNLTGGDVSCTLPGVDKWIHIPQRLPIIVLAGNYRCRTPDGESIYVLTSNKYVFEPARSKN